MLNNAYLYTNYLNVFQSFSFQDVFLIFVCAYFEMIEIPSISLLMIYIVPVNQKSSGYPGSPPGFSSGTGQQRGELMAPSTIHV